MSLWIGIGFQNHAIFPDLLTGTWETLLSNGMTTGAVTVILLSLLMDLTTPRRQRLNARLDPSSLPEIDGFLSWGRGEEQLGRGIDRQTARRG